MTVDPGPKGRARQKQIEAHDRQLQALNLRKAGMTYDAIAVAAGYKSKQAAWKAVGAALKMTLREEGTDELRSLEVERVDVALKSIWAQVLSGNLGAVDRFIRLSERRARLLGLDTPIKIAPTTPDGKDAWKVGLTPEQAEAAEEGTATLLERILTGQAVAEQAQAGETKETE